MSRKKDSDFALGGQYPARTATCKDAAVLRRWGGPKAVDLNVAGVHPLAQEVDGFAATGPIDSAHQNNDGKFLPPEPG